MISKLMGGGGRSGCKTLLGARCRHRKVVQTTTWQSNKVGPFTDQEPGPTRVVDRPKGWVGFFMEVGLKSRNNGLSGPTGVVPTACNSWCIHRLCLMGECATAGTGAGRPDGPTARSS